MLPYDQSKNPPCPVVHIHITDHRRGLQIPRFLAQIDTGADHTCIPKAIIPSIHDFDHDFVEVLNYNGIIRREPCIRMLKATIEFSDPRRGVFLRKDYKNLLLLVIDCGLLGRDILNHHVCEFVGPQLNCSII